MTAIAPHHGSRRWLVPILAPTVIAIVGCTSAASPSPLPSAAPALPAASAEPSAPPIASASVTPSEAPSPVATASPAPLPSPSLPATIGAAPAGPWTGLAWFDTGKALPLTAPAGSDTFALDVFGWSGGYVAFAGDAGSSESSSPATLRFTSSRDGVQWAAPKPMSLKGLYDEVEIVELAESPRGLVAVGEYPPGTCGGPETYAGLWTSADGTSWTRVQEPAAMAAAGVTSLNGGPAGFIATGTSATDAPEVWLSSDGAAWHAATLPQVAKGKLVVEDGYSVPGGFVLSGAILGPGECGGPAHLHHAVWWSADGTTWSQEPLPGASAATDDTLWLRRLADGGLVAVEQGPGDGPKVDWVTADGKTWKPATAPVEDLPFQVITDGRHAIFSQEDPNNAGPWTISEVADDLGATTLDQTGAVPTEVDRQPGFIFAVGPTGLVAVKADGSSVRLGMPGA